MNTEYEKPDNFNELTDFEKDAEIRKWLEVIEEEEICSFSDEEFVNTPFGKLQVVNEYGGEGQGERIGMVIHFIEHNLYLEVSTYYDSWNGYDYKEGTWFTVYPCIQVSKVYTGHKFTEEELEKEKQKLEQFKSEILK